MKYIFDFDETIFDTEKFKQKEIIKMTGREYSKENWKEDIFLAIKFLENNIHNNISYYKYLVKDFLDFIKIHNKNDIYILTKGNKEFQKLKIKKSGADKLVKKFFIVEESKADILKDLCVKFKEEIVIFIDNEKVNFIVEDRPNNLKQYLNFKDFKNEYNEKLNK